MGELQRVTTTDELTRILDAHPSYRPESGDTLEDYAYYLVRNGIKHYVDTLPEMIRQDEEGKEQMIKALTYSFERGIRQAVEAWIN